MRYGHVLLLFGRVALLTSQDIINIHNVEIGIDTNLLVRLTFDEVTLTGEMPVVLAQYKHFSKNLVHVA